MVRKENEDVLRKKKKERMADNKIGAEGATALSEMLKVNTALTEIYLRCEYEKEEKKDNMTNGRQAIKLEMKEQWQSLKR